MIAQAGVNITEYIVRNTRNYTPHALTEFELSSINSLFIRTEKITLFLGSPCITWLRGRFRQTIFNHINALCISRKTYIIVYTLRISHPYWKTQYNFLAIWMLGLEINLCSIRILGFHKLFVFLQSGFEVSSNASISIASPINQIVIGYTELFGRN